MFKLADNTLPLTLRAAALMAAPLPMGCRFSFLEAQELAVAFVMHYEHSAQTKQPLPSKL